MLGTFVFRKRISVSKEGESRASELPLQMLFLIMTREAEQGCKDEARFAGKARAVMLEISQQQSV